MKDNHTPGEPKLKPCPFCKESRVRFIAVIGPCHGDCWVECLSCRACGPVCGSPAEAILLWDKNNDLLGECLEALEWYADLGNYRKLISDGKMSGILTDSGTKASAILAKRKGEK